MQDHNSFELQQVSIRLEKERPLLSNKPIVRPEDAIVLVKDLLDDYDREVMCLVNLQTDGKPINMNIASMGTINASLVSPRELFKAAILSNAAAMILIHNHPSGRIQPSREDHLVTKQMQELCDIMGIPLLDHIIIGAGNDKMYSIVHDTTYDKPGRNGGFREQRPAYRVPGQFNHEIER